MDQLVGFTDQEHPQQKRRLQKSLYRLKQFARNWNSTFHSKIKKFGLQQSGVDPHVYIGRFQGQLVILTIFVDDGIIYCVNQAHIDAILSHMGKVFSITQGYPEIYIGLHITRD